MTQEEKFVVNPLEKYLLNKKRSGAKWETHHRPRYGTGATGWDLIMTRKNRILYIEAKYIRGSFIGSFSGLVTSPLTNHKTPGWSYEICWAIGCGWHENPKMTQRHLFQILFDYLCRNGEFWKFYTKTLKVGSVFFVSKNRKVARIKFSKLLELSIKYGEILKKRNIDIYDKKKETINAKREIVDNILKLEFK